MKETFDGKPTGEQENSSSDSYGFQEAMKDVPEFGQGLAKNNYHEYDNIDRRINITGESIRHYMDDRSQENFNFIKSKNKPFLADIYKNLMQEYPMLINVMVCDKNIEGNAYYSCASTFADGQVLPTMNFNFSNTETYLKPENMKEGDNFGLEYVLKTIALKTGAKPSEMMRNERLITSFIMLHEFGHAFDFQKNNLGVELNRLEGKGKGVRALPVALAREREDRLKDMMSQPIPGQVSADNYLELVVPFARRLEALGINPHDSDEVINGMKKGYREMSSEAFADNFAVDYIIKHYDDFFENSDLGVGPSEKVKTHIGELMHIDQNMEILGLAEGKAVRMTKVEIHRDNNGKAVIVEGNPPRTKTGFLEKKMKLNEGIKLLREGDPTSKERYQESPTLTGIAIRPQKDRLGNVKNDILVRLGGNDQGDLRYYLVELTGEEPKEIDVSSEEIINRYRIGFGSKIMLMKRTKEDSSAVSLGAILGGRLMNHYGDSSPIKEGHGVYLSSTVGEKTGVGDLVDPGYMNGGNTSHIKRLYRKWKNYYIETETSTYEVIPYR